MSYRTKVRPESTEHIKMLVMKQIELTETLEKITDVLKLADPAAVQAAYTALQLEGRIEPKGNGQ